MTYAVPAAAAKVKPPSASAAVVHFAARGRRPVARARGAAAARLVESATATPCYYTAVQQPGVSFAI